MSFIVTPGFRYFYEETKAPAGYEKTNSCTGSFVAEDEQGENIVATLLNVQYLSLIHICCQKQTQF